jgi:hypothetical protein
MSSETDNIELRFDFASFVPDDEMNTMIGRYFEENAMNIKPLYTEYIKDGGKTFFKGITKKQFLTYPFIC